MSTASISETTRELVDRLNLEAEGDPATLALELSRRLLSADAPKTVEVQAEDLEFREAV